MLAAMQLAIIYPPLTSCDKLGVDIHNMNVTSWMLSFSQTGKVPLPRHKYVDENVPRYITYGRAVASSILLLGMLHNFSIPLFSNQCVDCVVCIHDRELYVCACVCKGCWG